MWTKDALQDLIRDRLSGHQFFVVANREPYMHRYVGNRIECVRPASGMVTALDPILRACGGTWVAHGCGTPTADGRRERPPPGPARGPEATRSAASG